MKTQDQIIQEAYVTSKYVDLVIEALKLPDPDQREKELIKLHGAFPPGNLVDTSAARRLLDKNMLNATPEEKKLLLKHFDSNGKLIPRSE
jgi:hypothetical protein